jgi:carbonic anhydrase/acetyltransferase-like protein (isoleucine patch superfamily)
MKTKEKKHFKLTNEGIITPAGVKLYRIRCTRDIQHAKKGDLGGFIEKQENLLDDAWVGGEAQVYGYAQVCDNALVSGEAQVYIHALVCDNAQVLGQAKVRGNACIFGNAQAGGEALVCDNAQVYGYARVLGNVQVRDNARVCDALVDGRAQIFDNVQVSGSVRISDNAQVSGEVLVSGVVRLSDNAQVSGDSDYYCFQSFDEAGVTITAFREKEGKIRLKCEIFSGTLDEFEKWIEKTYGDSQYGRQYKAIVEVLKIRFNLKVTMETTTESNIPEFVIPELN